MRLRLPPVGIILRPVPRTPTDVPSGDVPGTTTVDDVRDKAPVPARNRDGGLPALFARLPSGDVRTKPSYTDCWMISESCELEPLTSYVTGDGSVLIGISERDGETEYNLTPREYAYPDGLNSVVMDVVDGIRDRYRANGGALDRDSVMGMAREILMDRSADIMDAVGTQDIDRVVEDVCSIAYRHTVGAGVFEVLLSDPHIEDVYIDAPCSRNRVHVTLNGIEGLNSHIRCRTNLMVEDREVDNLINILRRESGLRFCASSPVLETDFRDFDARVTVVGHPMSPNGNAVAIRKRSARPWTLSRLISNGTVDPRTAGILSYLVNSRATFLICGARGAGKSSLLSALMFEFPLSQRILTIEDTIELPGEVMRRMGYKVQTLVVDERIRGDHLSRSEEALRVSLRLGESAIVLGEVRGEEARTLYQSMRAGRAGSSILGTIHGDSAESVYNRVVFDMGISPEAFMATDVLVTLGTVRDRRTGHTIRRVSEMVATCGRPGEFMDISETDRLLESPVIRRAMQTSQSGRREIAKEIRARSMMRSHLAELGVSDERFLEPEWILAANDVLSGMPRGSSAEDALREFRKRTGADA